MSRRPALFALALVALPLAGCPIGNDKYPKPADLDPVWRVDRLRILGIAAEPPEIRPGETTTFSALVIDPEGTAGGTAWLACPTDADDGGIGFGCPIDAGLDFGTATPEELAAAGFIGFEPFLAPVYTAPADLLDGLTDFEALDGVYVLAQAAVLPASVIEGGASEGFDFNEVEVGYKRLVVSSSTEPNANPAILRFTVDGYPLPLGVTLEVDPDQLYEIGVELVPGADEVYTYTNAEGVTEERKEEPYASWYASGGEVTETTTLWGYNESTWISPPADAPATEGTVWVVVRDRRGGMSWASLPWKLR